MIFYSKLQDIQSPACNIMKRGTHNDDDGMGMVFWGAGGGIDIIFHVSGVQDQTE